MLSNLRNELISLKTAAGSDRYIPRALEFSAGPIEYGMKYRIARYWSVTFKCKPCATMVALSHRL